MDRRLRHLRVIYILFPSRASLGTPLSQLQNSISQHSVSIKDMRKMTHVKPAKPIEPEMCLEHIWTENTYGT